MYSLNCYKAYVTVFDKSQLPCIITYVYVHVYFKKPYAQTQSELDSTTLCMYVVIYTCTYIRTYVAAY